jgi:hypothetical protein
MHAVAAMQAMNTVTWDCGALATHPEEAANATLFMPRYSVALIDTDEHKTALTNHYRGC